MDMWETRAQLEVLHSERRNGSLPPTCNLRETISTQLRIHRISTKESLGVVRNFPQQCKSPVLQKSKSHDHSAVEGDFNAQTACAPHNAGCVAQKLYGITGIPGIPGKNGEQDWQASAHGHIRVSQT